MPDSPPASDLAIEVRDLVKRYTKANFNAVDGINYSVPRGKIYGLLGPNGAGKTTTIGVLTTSVKPTSGSAYIMGVDVAKDPISTKQRIAVVPQQSNLDRSLRVREILTFHAAYHGIAKRDREERADALLTELGLFDRRNDKVLRYSGGQAQRLMIARALMHSPDVLFLDEPTNNLDPQSRLFLWDRIRALNAAGLTILLTTHDMDEADHLCERIAIMDHGKILVNDTSANLKQMIPGGTALELRIRVPEMANSEMANSAASDAPASTDRIAETLRALPGVEKVDKVKTEAPALAAAGAGPRGGGPRGGGPGGPWADAGGAPAPERVEDGTALFRLYAQDAGALVIPATQVLAAAGAELRDLHVKRPSLEDVFIFLTGRQLR